MSLLAQLFEDWRGERILFSAKGIDPICPESFLPPLVHPVHRRLKILNRSLDIASQRPRQTAPITILPFFKFKHDLLFTGNIRSITSPRHFQLDKIAEI
jgi:hypothetical protein